MHFDEGSLKFSKEHEAVDGGSNVVAWPSFLPDSGGLVYQEGSSFDTGNHDTFVHGNVRMVDLGDGGAPITLDTLNGTKDGEFYLPYGADEEQNLNYEPTVLPVPVGGFYWVLFTSRRKPTATRLSPAAPKAANDAWSGPEQGGQRRGDQLAQEDLGRRDRSTTRADDPSHPRSICRGRRSGPATCARSGRRSRARRKGRASPAKSAAAASVAKPGEKGHQARARVRTAAPRTAARISKRRARRLPIAATRRFSLHQRSLRRGQCPHQE